MSDEEPRVTLRFIEKGALSFCRAKLIFEQGQPFAVADDGPLGTLPEDARIPLDALFLVEQLDAPLDFPLFLYRLTITLPIDL
jgi:hypothetical protein